MRRLSTLLLFFVAACGDEEPPEKLSLDATNNRAVGLMGRFEYSAARELLARLARDYPQQLDVKVNLAIATLNRQQKGDTARAMKLLEEVLAAKPDHLRARYCTGLLLLYEGEVDAALARFAAVADADPDDPYPMYHAGLCLLNLGRPREAAERFRKVIELDPYQRSAYYGLARVLRQLGEKDEAGAHLARFTKLKDNPQARQVAFKYSQMGPKGELQPLDAAPEQPPRTAARPFGEPAPLRVAGDVAWGTPRDLTACDIDGDGRLDLFLASDSGTLVLRAVDGGFAAVPDHPLAGIQGVTAALWGDVDNDGRADVYLCREGPNQLWLQSASGWTDTTTTARVAGGDRATIGGAVFDADHDGDLDFFLLNRDGPNELLSNNRDGTFRPLAAEFGLGGAGTPRGLALADVDGDRDVDVLVVNESPPHTLYVNDLHWSYRVAAPSDLTRTPLRAVVAADLDADGTPEFCGVVPGRGLAVWRDGPDGPPTIVEPGVGAGRLAAVDVDGDGAPNLVHGFDAPVWTVFADDPRRGPSVIAARAKAAPRLWPPAADRPDYLALAFTGKDSDAEQMRSNRSGIGVVAALRVGRSWAAVHTLRWQSGPGQGLQPYPVGLGGAKRADFVQMLWPDGVFQTELDLGAGAVHVLAEAQRQLSSCPVLFAWNGARHAFVTDVLGVGGIGFNVGRAEYGPPRPWENLLLPAGVLRPRAGRYVLKVGEPMEEACYLDGVSLVAWDLPPGWKMTIDDRFAIGGPAPKGEPVFYRRELVPERATNDRGEDVTAALAAADLVAAEPGALDPRFLGRTAPHHVTLVFATRLDEGPGTPVLVADGWIEYPYSQTMFAAWQAGAAYDAPTLEARGADGEWRVVVEQFGYPAGMPRQMSLPLAGLPAGADALRIRTNQEIYWDRIVVVRAEPCPQARRREATLVVAEVRRTGFARRTTGAQRVPHYDYERRSPDWDTRHQVGYYTAFGPCLPLVRAVDDACAIIGPGEEVHVEFEAPGAPPADWTRRWVLVSAGWCKDMDLYTKDGETVGPLPRRAEATAAERRRRDALHRRFNTRFEAGR